MNYQESLRGRSILLMISSALFFSVMSAFVKMAGDLPSIEKALFRNLISLIIAFTILKVRKQPLWGQKENRKILLLRALTGSLGILFYFYSIDHLILADSSMLNKMSPFFVILFARIILKNPIKPFQIFSLILAVAGSFLIIKPGFQYSTPLPALIGLSSAVFAGLAYTMVSYLGGKENAFTIVFYFSLISTIVCLPFVFINPVLPSLPQFLLLLGAGITAAGGQFLLTAAYKYAPAGEVSVYQYSQIVFASLLGILFFTEIPDLFSLGGYILIFAAGNMISRKGIKSRK
ncbi:DMT family transporter [Oceanispirochaeta sp.]|jgi:drug/metabolite transporter (DMT)-like permease|uniref:DMT family transporter n=1 Tax=Oceanispirochaeta sp. TaxID=2035350 RepID=UPI00261D052E|nr:DMT family transporter [Oceanispirochaeta sp.]MDA3958282.1 DMT family transporter [Oceanispirochaeta sp.]